MTVRTATRPSTAFCPSPTVIKWLIPSEVFGRRPERYITLVWYVNPCAEVWPENVAFAVRFEVLMKVPDVAFPTSQSLECNVSVHCNGYEVHGQGTHRPRLYPLLIISWSSVFKRVRAQIKNNDRGTTHERREVHTIQPEISHPSSQSGRPVSSSGSDYHPLQSPCTSPVLDPRSSNA